MGSLYCLVDIVIIYCEVDFEVPIIIGIPFLATANALVDMEIGQIKFRHNKDEITLNICRSMKQRGERQYISAIRYRFESESKV